MTDQAPPAKKPAKSKTCFDIRDECLKELFGRRRAAEARVRGYDELFRVLKNAEMDPAGWRQLRAILTDSGMPF